MTSSEGSESSVVSALFWQFYIKQQWVIELCLVFQTDSQKLFISFLLHGKIISQGECQSFLHFFWWNRGAEGEKKMEGGFRDATLETWNRQSHCLIRLSIQLTLLHRTKAQINPIWWLEGDSKALGAAHMQIYPEPVHTWDTVQWSSGSGRYNVSALCWATAPI